MAKLEFKMPYEKIHELLDGPVSELTFGVDHIEVSVPYVFRKTTTNDYLCDDFLLHAGLRKELKSAKLMV